MVIDFWGVRGSMPVAGKNFLRHGGHTLCTSVREDSKADEMIILDAGTGLKQLGEKIIEGLDIMNLRLHFLFTHFHLDHVIGLPFFAPLYSARAKIIFYSPLSPPETRKQLTSLMGGRFFPVAFGETDSLKSFRRIPDQGLAIGKFRVMSCPLHHPQGSVAYKIEMDGKSMVTATDTEPPEGRLDERLAVFVRGADCLVYDATFTPEEYKKRQGWGHSTWQHGTALAREAKVGRLFLSHFNPDHEDSVIDQMVRQARCEFRSTWAACEGLKFKI